MMSNTEKRELVTLREYFDAGVTRKFPNGFCIYDMDLKNYEEEKLNLTAKVDDLFDCEVISIDYDPDDSKMAIYISTVEFRKKNNLSDDDIRNMVIDCENYSIDFNHAPSSIISFGDDNYLIVDIMSRIRDMGAISSKTKLFIILNTPVKHYANFYSFLFSKLNYDDDKEEKIFSDDKIINYVTELISILVVNKVFKITKYEYHICVDYDKNKEKINKTLLSLSAYINTNYR